MERVEEMTPEVERRVRQAAKLLATGAIRAAAEQGKVNVTPERELSASVGAEAESVAA